MEFEKRRHVPVKYNRELIDTTLKVMHRVNDIKQRRQKDLWKARMHNTAQHEVKTKVRLLNNHLDWVDPIHKPEVEKNIEAVRAHQKELKQNATARKKAVAAKRAAAEKQEAESA